MDEDAAGKEADAEAAALEERILRGDCFGYIDDTGKVEHCSGTLYNSILISLMACV